MLGTVEKLAEIFEITPDTISNWETENCSGGKTAFLKDVKSLVLAGHSLQEIRQRIFEQKGRQKQNETVVYLDRSDIRNQSSPDFKMSKSEIFSLFTAILQEMRQYTDRAIDAEKKVSLLEDYDGRAKNEYFELNTEVKRLKIQLDEKEKKLREFEEQKKRLNLMEVQLKILHLENSKKNFWEFWKK